MTVPIDPTLIAYTGLQMFRLVARQVERMEAGEISPEQVQEDWAAVGLRVEAANAAWEAAGRSSVPE